jgi:DNA-binding response OmpR family regulator
VHVLIAADAQWVVDDVVSALSTPETSFTVCRNGRDVTGVVKARTPDIAILDLQSGSMGGMAVTMNLRLDESSGAVPHIPVLMLLDREPDIFLARRSGADAWLLKPLNPLEVQRTVNAILHPPVPAVVAPADDGLADTEIAGETAEEEPAASG